MNAMHLLRAASLSLLVLFCADASASATRTLCGTTVDATSYSGPFPYWFDDTATIVGSDPATGNLVFLGRVSTSDSSADSILNETGTFGAVASPSSLFNPAGTWGSSNGTSSACNPFASTSRLPLIVWHNQVVGTLTESAFDTNAISPVTLVAALLKAKANQGTDTIAPSVPTGVAAVGTSASEISLTWNLSTDNVAVTQYRVYVNGTLLGTVPSVGVLIGNFAPSTTYTFAVSACDAAQNCSALSSTVSATTLPVGGSAINHTGLWWNPAESGWGLNVNHQGNTVFATLFAYDAAGNAMWLVMSNGTMLADGATFSGDLYQTTGSPFNATPIVPSGPGNVVRVGEMTITFATADTATLVYSVNGSVVVKLLSKQVFGSRAALCTSSNASRAGLGNYQDLWWNPAEAGWGVNITHQDNTLFATLFTYDASGKALWLVMSGGTLQADGSYAGTLYRTTGTPFMTQPFMPSGAGNLSTVGTMHFRFQDGNNGVLTYSVNGLTVTKAITRQTYSAPLPNCVS
jgi:hypothetical protein